MSNVLVTGGAGYIGSHICKVLATAGYLPVTYDNLSRGFSEFVKWGPLIEGNINDSRFLVDVINKYSIKSVIHCAALAYVRESFEIPVDYYENNVSGSISLLRAMKETKVSSLVLSSSCSVYGTPQSIPVKETSSIRPISVYGTTKAIVEELVVDCVKASSLSAVSLRYFNAAGADPEGLIGERHDPEPHVIPSILKNALGSSKIFKLYGTDFDTPDGTAVRDYVHVVDIAEAHLLALQYTFSSPGYNVFNIGSGSGVSIYKLIEVIETILGVKIQVEKHDRKIGDPAVLVADNTLIRKKLNWEASRPQIENIINDAILYMKTLGVKMKV